MKDTPTTEMKEQKSGHQIAGRWYELARLTVKVSGNTVLQELYVTEAGEQAVMFALTAKDEPTLAQLKGMMDSVRWAERRSPSPGG